MSEEKRIKQDYEHFLRTGDDYPHMQRTHDKKTSEKLVSASVWLFSLAVGAFILFSILFWK